MKRSEWDSVDGCSREGEERGLSEKSGGEKGDSWVVAPRF